VTKCISNQRLEDINAQNGECESFGISVGGDLNHKVVHAIRSNSTLWIQHDSYLHATRSSENAHQLAKYMAE